jgi:type II secretory pathway pseudopilin PulG
MSTSRQSGFTLLEVLPALLVLMGALVIASRMLSHAVETRIRAQQVAVVEEIMAPVWEHWRVNGGSVALAGKEAGRDWTINTFPDETWLPVNAGTVGVNTFILRRLWLSDPVGWEISYLAGNASAADGWRVLTRVLTGELGAPGE